MAVVATAEPIIANPPEVRSARDIAFAGWLIFVLLSIIPVAVLAGLSGIAPFSGWWAAENVVEVIGDMLFHVPFIAVPPPPSPTHIVAHIMLCRDPVTGGPTPTPTPPGCIPPSLGITGPILGLILGGLDVAFIIIAILAFMTSIHAVDRGRYESGRKAALGWAIVFLLVGLPFSVLILPSLIASGTFALSLLVLLGSILVFGSSLIVTFLFLVAYAKLGEAVVKYGPVPLVGVPAAVPAMAVAASPGGVGAGVQVTQPGVPPTGVQPSPQVQPRVVAPNPPLCPSCGSPLYYTAKYRRWYCLRCEGAS